MAYQWFTGSIGEEMAVRDSVLDLVTVAKLKSLRSYQSLLKSLSTVFYSYLYYSNMFNGRVWAIQGIQRIVWTGFRGLLQFLVCVQK